MVASRNEHMILRFRRAVESHQSFQEKWFMPEKKVSKLFKILEENMIMVLYPAKPTFRYKEYKHIRSQRIIFLWILFKKIY